MRFKRNITITIACVITECLISLMPAIFILYIFFMIDKFDGILSSLLIIPYLILITNVILFIISLIAQIFLKTKYCVNKESIVVIKKDNAKTIKYSEISSIVYDFGDITKFNTQPSQLILFNEENKPLLSVNNPSIIMVCMIIKKCKNIKVGYYNSKRFIYLLLLINTAVLLFSAFVKIFL